MTMHGGDHVAALDAAAEHARDWLASVGERAVPPRSDIDAVLAALAGPLPEHGTAPRDVVDELAAAVEPGLMAIGSG
ncbi:MAG: aspartate aminotransferase family protein, partial [Cellulomonas sp.]|nr:aspartate aminotransferase family protein [Cellulomonas sp.]